MPVIQRDDKYWCSACGAQLLKRSLDTCPYCNHSFARERLL